MFCAKCGNEVAEGAAFCSNCGTGSNGQPSASQTLQDGRAFSESMDAYHRRRLAQEAAGREVREATDQANLAAQEYLRLRKRKTNCTIVAIILAFWVGSVFWMWLQASGNMGQTAFMAGFGAFIGLTFPFGFMPIKDFITNHGFFIVFAAAFVAVMFLLVLAFTVFAGVPYYFYLRSKIASAKRDMELLQGHADALAAAR